MVEIVPVRKGGRKFFRVDAYDSQGDNSAGDLFLVRKDAKDYAEILSYFVWTRKFLSEVRQTEKKFDQENLYVNKPQKEIAKKKFKEISSSILQLSWYLITLKSKFYQRRTED